MPTLAASFACLLFLCRPAHAYMDGGTGSMIVQTLLAGFGGVLVFLRLRWRALFKKKPRRDGELPPDGNRL